MKKQSQENTRERIIRTLRIKGPLRLTDLANLLSKSPSTITYHLNLLTDQGTLVANEEKFYNVAEEGDIGEAILSAIKEHGALRMSDLLRLEELRVFGEKIHAAFRNLITKGLLVERDEVIKLTRWGTNKLGVCYVCYKPVTGDSVVSFVTDLLYEIEGTVQLGDVPGQVTAILIHPRCFRKLAREIIGGFSSIHIPDDCFCDHCGLPLSIGVYRMLVEGIGVSLQELRGHLLKFENEIVDKTKPWPWFYRLQDIEELVMKIAEGAKKKGIDYDLNKRQQELWRVSQSTMEKKKERINETIRTLFSPIEIAYSKIMSSQVTEDIHFVIRKETAAYIPSERGFGMVFVQKDGKRMHPYCASILKQ